uniref:Adhesin n=1 Tax=Elaeophora elaphi TaxID=1147741 RepID=A0A0R3RP13_9BILA
MLGGTLTSNDNITLSNGSNNRDDTSTCTGTITITINNNQCKRDDCGNRLDAMVRKLANWQKEKETAAAAILASGSTGVSM